MKYLGIWFLSFFAWLAIAMIEVWWRKRGGESKESCVDQGSSTIKVGMILTAILLAGIWLVRQ